MPEIQDAALARALARRYFIKGGYSPVLAPEVVPVILVDDISGYETGISGKQPAVASTTSAAVAGQFGHTSLAPLAGLIVHCSAITFGSNAAGIFYVRLGAPLTGGTAVGPLFADRRQAGTPSVDFRYHANVALQGTQVNAYNLAANTSIRIPVDFTLTNAQGLLTAFGTVNVGYRVSFEFEVLDETPIPG